MALLQKTREKAGLAVSIIIALALLSFIIDPGTLESAFQSMSSKNNVGEINGKAIPYTDFQQDVERFSTISEMLTGQSAQSEQQQAQIRNVAWQSLIDKYLFTKKAKAAGIRVGKEEMQALLTGDMVSPVVSSNPAFQDENGNFSKDAVMNLINGIGQDNTGRLKEFWNYIQNTVYTQQFYAKYGSLFTSGNFQNPLMLKRAIAENNNTSKVDFVMVPTTYQPDSTIKISNEEIKKYYEAHKQLYKQQASRDIEYVVYDVQPSDSDIAATNKAIADVYDEFKTTPNEDMKSFLAKNSERAYSDYWYKSGELSVINKEINDFVFNNAEGVSPIVSANNIFYTARIMATGQIPDSAYVKHILLQGDDVSKADSLLNVVREGGNFANLAAQYSADKRSAADGVQGNIGWLTQNIMIPGFESIFTEKIGEPFILKTQYGTHIVEVEKKTAPVAKKQVAILEKTAVASAETFNEYFSKASKFAGLAKKSYKDYRAAVDTLGVYSHPMSNVLESTSSYGSIDNAKEVTRWVFDNKVGKVSDIITVNNNYFFIVAVTGIHKEGIADVSEVREPIRQYLYSEKASKKAAQMVADKVKGLSDLQTIADTLHASISTDVDVRFASMAGQGLDPIFIGAASVAPEGKLCGPLAASMGTYIYNVKSRETGSFYTEDDAKNNQAKMNEYSSQMILPVMINDADVKDHRARFY